MKEKLKSYLLNDQIFYGFVVIFIGIISFYLGRLSVGENVVADAKLQIINPITLPANVINTTTQTDNSKQSVQQITNKQGKYVASKNGTKYYLLNCSGVKRIKPENIVYFSTQNEAEAAGYTKAANCPGL